MVGFAADLRKRNFHNSRLYGNSSDKGDAVNPAIPKGFKIGKL